MLGQETKPNAAVGYDETALRDHLLAAMRVSSIRLLLTKVELDSIGTALKGGLIGTAEALDWLDDVGAMPLIDAALGGRSQRDASVAELAIDPTADVRLVSRVPHDREQV